MLSRRYASLLSVFLDLLGHISTDWSCWRSRICQAQSGIPTVTGASVREAGRWFSLHQTLWHRCQLIFASRNQSPWLTAQLKIWTVLAGWLGWLESHPVFQNDILPFATIWMDLENILLSKISQSQKHKYHMIHSYVESNKQTELTRKTETDS